MKLPVFRWLNVVVIFVMVCGGVKVLRSQAGIVAAPEPSAAERKLNDLGPLKADLDLWLSMDSTERGGVAWSRIRKHLPEGDPLTNLIDLQGVLLTATGVTCATGVAVACGASILAVVAVTGAIWLMINDRVNDGKLSQSQGQCLRAVNLLPIPFPLPVLKVGVCDAMFGQDGGGEYEGRDPDV